MAEVGFAPEPRLLPTMGRPNPRGPQSAGDEANRLLVGAMRQDWKADKLARLEIEREWYEGGALVMGRHYAWYSTELGRLLEPKRKPWQVRAVHNFTQKTKRIICSRLRAARPMPTTIPMGGEDRRRSSAAMGSLLQEHVYRERDMDVITREWINWFVTCGTAFLMPFWNPDIGPWDERAQMRIGDIDVACIPPFFVYPDRRAISNSTLRYLTLASVRDVEWLKAKFPDYSDVIRSEPVEEVFDPNRMAARQSPDGSGAFLSGWSGPDSGRALMLTRYEVPSPQFPMGRTMVAVGDALVQYFERLPLGVPDRPMIPLIKCDYEEVPGRWWGRGLPQIIASPQTEYNRWLSRLQEIANLTGSPKLLINEMSNIDTKNLDNSPGGFIKYVNKPPSYLIPPPVPAILINLLGIAKNNIMELAGVSEVQEGRTPPNVEAGVAIQLLQQSMDFQLSNTVEAMAVAMRDVGRGILWLAKHLYREPRVLRIAGEDYRWHAAEFAAMDLAGAYDVTVDVGDASELNKVVWESKLMRLYAMGVLGAPGSPQARRVLLRALNHGRLEAAINDTERDLEMMLQRLIMQMSYGQMMPQGGPAMAGMGATGSPAQQMQSVGEGMGPLPQAGMGGDEEQPSMGVVQ